MSTQLPRFRFLAVIGREGMHFASPFIRKLERHMSQSADADDSHTGSGGHVMNEEWRKYSDSSAKEWSDFCQVQRVWQRANPSPLSSDTVRKAAVASDNGPPGSGAKVLVAGKAFVAREATMSK